MQVSTLQPEGREGREAFPGRCCGDPLVEFVPGAGVAVKGKCERPNLMFCVRCGCSADVRCQSSRRSDCGYCASIYRRSVRQVCEDGINKVADGAALCLTVTGQGDRLHCRRHKHCEVTGPECDPCPCTPVGGCDVGEQNATFTARLNRVLEAIRRGEASPKVKGRRAPVPLEYFAGREPQLKTGRGALHAHIPLVRSDGKVLQLDKRLLRDLLMRHGFGHSMYLDRLSTSKHPGSKRGYRRTRSLSFYVSKYVSDAADNRAAVPWRAPGPDPDKGKRWRTWTSSRGWGSSMKAVREARRAAAMEAALGRPVAALDLLRESYAIEVEEERKKNIENAVGMVTKAFGATLEGSDHPPPHNPAYAGQVAGGSGGLPQYQHAYALDGAGVKATRPPFAVTPAPPSPQLFG